MERVMGPFPRSPRAPLAMEEQESVDTPAFVRKKITYVSELGDRVPAYLLVPRKPARGAAILCLHQTTRIGKAEPAGVGGLPNLHYAAELAERGFVTLAPDYPNFGDYRFDPYAHGYLSATMKGIWNHSRAVDLLESLGHRRVGCIGHSLGGHNTLFLAVFEPRVRAMVTSCGFTSFHRYMGGDLTGWSHKGYMPKIFEHKFDFPEILASLAPRPLFINAPLHDSNFDVTGVRECIEVAREKYRGDRLQVVYPDAKHDFPPEVREQAYGFLEKWLG